MEKKVAILTQPLGLNYGGIIQNYALQKVLKNLDHEPITINITKHKKIGLFISMKKRLAFILKRHLPGIPITGWTLKKITRNNHDFIQRNITITKPLYDIKKVNFFFLKHKFDIFIVGSDQVWRPKYSPNIETYFLDFIENSNSNIKRIAYAASFGTAEWEFSDEEEARCRPLIKKFNAVSVREESGVDLCKKHFDTDAQHVLDPTLLLSAEDYSNVIDLPKKDLGLFTYVLDAGTELDNFIHSCSKSLKLSISKNQASCDYYNRTSKRVNDYIIPPLEGWLQGFRDAKFIITDSFHGTVFSIINKKPFLAVVNNKRGAARFKSLLSKLNLEDRLIYDFKDFNPDILFKPIDYNDVSQKLRLLKEDSLNFLKQNI